MAVDADTVLVGRRGGGSKRSLDGADTFEKSARAGADVIRLAVSAADGAVHAGTQPSRLFRCRIRGRESAARAYTCAWIQPASSPAYPGIGQGWIRGPTLRLGCAEAVFAVDAASLCGRGRAFAGR